MHHDHAIVLINGQIMKPTCAVCNDANISAKRTVFCLIVHAVFGPIVFRNALHFVHLLSLPSKEGTLLQGCWFLALVLHLWPLPWTPWPTHKFYSVFCTVILLNLLCSEVQSFGSRRVK